MNDLALILLSNFFGGLLVNILLLPEFFGYILAGILLGPGGYIHNEVQVETISKGLGVIFIMFHLGLEFNLSKIRKMFVVSILGSTLLLLVTIGASYFAGSYYNRTPAECFTVGSCLFLSSTVVVLHFLRPSEVDLGYGRIIMGILVTQDVLLGFLLMIIPAMKSSHLSLSAIVAEIIYPLIAFLCICAVIGPIFRFALSKLSQNIRSRESFLMGAIAFCLSVYQIGAYFGQSLELSCFVAGVICAGDARLSEKIIAATQQLKSVFSAMFFASLGLHLYPSFFMNELILLIVLAIFCMLFKIVCTFLVMWIIFRRTFRESFLVGVGLGQISEFVFVLASRAKQSGIIGREGFYLLIGTTAISMIFSPLLWSFVVGVYQKIDERQSINELDGSLLEVANSHFA